MAGIQGTLDTLVGLTQESLNIDKKDQLQEKTELRAEKIAAGETDIPPEIKDTGPGIDPDVSEHLFDRYWKGRHSLGEGSGLGLTIVEGILAAHGSQIEVETEIGKGSTFSFVLTRS